jgi:glycosyltransferase involved in cell wall biosynthesis
MNLHIIAAALPPTLDGIGDYTARLAAELAPLVNVTVLTDRNAVSHPVPGAKIRGVFEPGKPRSVLGIAQVVQAEKPNWVLLQYNPFAYGRRGLNLHLPRMIRSLSALSPGTRVAVMAHETYVPLNHWKFAVMTTWQRWQFFQLSLAADVLFFSIEPWLLRHRRWFRRQQLVHLPVGSNIPRVAISRAEARGRLGIDDDIIVLGIFGTAHASRLFNLVRNAAEAVRQTGRQVLVLYIGPDGSAVKRKLGDLPAVADGPFDAGEVSRRLAAVDVCLAPYIDGVSTRRGAMIAGLQHGLATVGTKGVHTDRLLLDVNGSALLLADVSDATGFIGHVMAIIEDERLRRSLSVEAKRLFEAEFDWPVIAHRVLSALGPVASSGPPRVVSGALEAVDQPFITEQ